MRDVIEPGLSREVVAVLALGVTLQKQLQVDVMEQSLRDAEGRDFFLLAPFQKDRHVRHDRPEDDPVRPARNDADPLIEKPFLLALQVHQPRGGVAEPLLHFRRSIRIVE